MPSKVRLYLSVVIGIYAAVVSSCSCRNKLGDKNYTTTAKDYAIHLDSDVLYTGQKVQLSLHDASSQQAIDSPEVVFQITTSSPDSTFEATSFIPQYPGSYTITALIDGKQVASIAESVSVKDYAIRLDSDVLYTGQKVQLSLHDASSQQAIDSPGVVFQITTSSPDSTFEATSFIPQYPGSYTITALIDGKQVASIAESVSVKDYAIHLDSDVLYTGQKVQLSLHDASSQQAIDSPEVVFQITTSSPDSTFEATSFIPQYPGSYTITALIDGKQVASIAESVSVKDYAIHLDPDVLYTGQKVQLSLHDASSQQAIDSPEVVFQITTSSPDSTFEATSFIPQYPGSYTITALIDGKQVASIAESVSVKDYAIHLDPDVLYTGQKVQLSLHDASSQQAIDSPGVVFQITTSSPDSTFEATSFIPQYPGSYTITALIDGKQVASIAESVSVKDYAIHLDSDVLYTGQKVQLSLHDASSQQAIDSPEVVFQITTSSPDSTFEATSFIPQYPGSYTITALIDGKQVASIAESVSVKDYAIHLDPDVLYTGQKVQLSLHDASSQQAIDSPEVVFQITTSSPDSTFEATSFIPQYPGSYTITALIDGKQVASIRSAAAASSKLGKRKLADLEDSMSNSSKREAKKARQDTNKTEDEGGGTEAESAESSEDTAPSAWEAITANLKMSKYFRERGKFIESIIEADGNNSDKASTAPNRDGQDKQVSTSSDSDPDWQSSGNIISSEGGASSDGMRDVGTLQGKNPSEAGDTAPSAGGVVPANLEMSAYFLEREKFMKSIIEADGNNSHKASPSPEGIEERVSTRDDSDDYSQSSASIISSEGGAWAALDDSDVAEGSFVSLEQVDQAATLEQVFPAIANLDSQEKLGNNTTIQWCKYLERKDSKFACVQEFIQPPLSGVKAEETRLNSFLKEFQEKLEKAQSQGESGVVFVPFVLQGSFNSLPVISSFFPNHIVVLAVNTQNKTFEYYDSKGQAIEQEKRHVVGLNNISANQLLKKLKEYTGQWNTRSSTKKHQKRTDFNNCGVFVNNFLDKRRTQGFDQICSDEGIHPATCRKAMADSLRKEKEFKLNTEEDIRALRKILKDEITRNKVEENVENYANALEGYKICFDSPSSEGRTIEIEQELKQLKEDLPRNLTIKIGEEDITQGIEEANARIIGAKTEREKADAISERDTLVSKVVEIIQQKIPSDQQKLILPYLHQGLWGDITTKLFRLIVNDHLSRIGDPHLKAQRVIKVSENFETITGEFPLCVEVIQDNDSGEQPLIEVFFEVFPESRKITCSFSSSLINVSLGREKTLSLDNKAKNSAFKTEVRQMLSTLYRKLL